MHDMEIMSAIQVCAIVVKPDSWTRDNWGIDVLDSGPSRQAQITSNILQDGPCDNTFNALQNWAVHFHFKLAQMC